LLLWAYGSLTYEKNVSFQFRKNSAMGYLIAPPPLQNATTDHHMQLQTRLHIVLASSTTHVLIQAKMKASLMSEE